MPASLQVFERLKSKGVEAFRQGDYTAARPHLLEAAECMIELAESARNASAKRQHEEIASELMELARECDRRRASGRNTDRRARVSDDDGNESAADDWIVREVPNIGFDDIAGLDDVKEDIRLKMIYPLQHPELADRYGIQSGGGVLLYGPPGTGKTMMAKAVAREVQATFFTISPAQIMSKWVGEAEQNIRKLFDAAKAEARSIIFVDEVEALVPRRTSDSSTVMQRVVPQILQELEGFDRKADRQLLFMGATNKPWMLDEALMRPGRLDTKVYVGLPDAPARMKLLEIHLADRPLAEDVDFGLLCDHLAGYSGADIKAIAHRAASIPFLEVVGGAAHRSITLADLLKVLEDTAPSVSPPDLAKFEKFREGGR